jgi:GTPase SAR1 family protein
VVIVGNGGVGKSSMIQRYCRGTFTKSYKKTIGKKIYRDNFYFPPQLIFKTTFLTVYIHQIKLLTIISCCQ